MEREITLLTSLCLFSCIAYTCTIIAKKSTLSTFVKSNYCQFVDHPYIKQIMLLTKRLNK